MSNSQQNNQQEEQWKPSTPKRRWLKWLLLALLLCPVGLLTGGAALNYSGFCFEQRRYLSDEERIRDAVDGALEHYSDIRFVHAELPQPGYPILKNIDSGSRRGDEKGMVLKAEQLIYYRNSDEFLSVNPGCCSVTREGLYGEFIYAGLFDKITGYSAGYVNLKFRVRYRDAANTVQSAFSAHSWNYTNCGKSVALL